MVLAFYKVNNSKGYDRHTFDMWFDRPHVIKSMLEELNEDEVKAYGTDYDKAIFQEDFNDELLNGGWWCVEIRD